MAPQPDPADLRALLAYLDPHIATMIRRFPVTPDEANDLRQLAMSELSRITIPADVRNPLGYLRQVAWKVIVEAGSPMVRDAQNRVSLPLGDHGNAFLVDTSPSPEEVFNEAEQMLSLEQALADLPELHRRVIGCLYYEGRTLDGTATALDLGRSTVQRYEREALSCMRASLRDHI